MQTPYVANMPVVVASRSPRRRDLLCQLIPPDSLVICPPTSPVEMGFDDCRSLDEIYKRLATIIEAKHSDVSDQLAGQRAPRAIIAADTILLVDHVVAGNSATRVLGQPDASDWKNVTRNWFQSMLAGSTHSVLTGFRVSAPHGISTGVARTEITIRNDVTSEELFEAFLISGESVGKAGGYGLQGLGSLFVERIEGSLTNVIGLPLEKLITTLRSLDVIRVRDMSG